MSCTEMNSDNWDEPEKVCHVLIVVVKRICGILWKQEKSNKPNDKNLHTVICKARISSEDLVYAHAQM